MAYSVKLRVWGAYASFNRPEMKVERVSYDVMTPSAARGILEAIYWKPGMRWIVNAIHVLKPILFTHVRRNEVGGKIPVKGSVGAAMKGKSADLGISVEEHRQQRAAMILRDVCYGIEAHIEILRPDIDADGMPLKNPEAKHIETFNRRAAKGQFFHQPYLGTREFPAFFELAEGFPACPEDLRGEHDLGLMLHDIEFHEDSKHGTIIESNEGRRLTATPRFFRAFMHDGVIPIPPLMDGERRIG
ncbi:MAG: type I-C CRISPR-associated protein Cas5 [Candidatus Aminicenantes bacterium]|nr:type I-C CRISPR-associated protein Cas5 [Candidatus Aminicenantes bacterium]